MACLFWQESSFRTNISRIAEGREYFGLGQMSKGACDGVDAAFGLSPGTCWKGQKSQDLCKQIGNSIAYLLHVFANPKAMMEGKELMVDAVWSYGGKGPYNVYSDPILACEKCLKKAAGGKTIEHISDCDSQACFDTMNKQVRKARTEN